VSLEARRGNLPGSAAALVGRSEVLPELAALVRSSPLVTLSGVGGVGKTSLALAVAEELADEFADGIWLVELAPVTDPEAVPDAIAAALGITPQGDARVIETVAEAVAGRQLLILLDNCEHVLVAASSAIREVVARSPVPRILATSREHLLIPGETAFTCPHWPWTEA
jgi:predicted ATPase